MTMVLTLASRPETRFTGTAVVAAPPSAV